MRILSVYILIFNFSFAGYSFNPENIALSGASSIAFNDFRSTNPAALAFHKGLTMKVLGASAGVGNNFLSISNYNDINGANFEDSGESNYFKKSDFYSFFNDGIRLNSQFAINLPFSDIAYNNISFSNKNYFMFDGHLPRSIMELILYGNELNKNYDLSLENSINIFSESSIGYAKSFNSFSIGIKLKYLQGLAYGELINLSDNSSYFYTDSIGFIGKAEYLINQGIGGSGFSLDLGIIYKEPQSDWKIGLSLNNLFGKIKWDDNNLTYNFLRNSIVNQLPLRHNEKQYFSLNLDTLNALNMLDMSLDEIYTTENFSVIEFEDIQDIPFDVDSLLNNDLLITTEYESYLLKSGNISDSLLNTINLNAQEHITAYPAYFNLTYQKLLEDDIELCLALSTGFSNSLRNSEKWKFSSGLLFNRFKHFPITLGVSFGGTENISSGFSVGYQRGPLLMNYAFSIREGIFLQSMQGLDISFSMLLNI